MKFLVYRSVLRCTSFYFSNMIHIYSFSTNIYSPNCQATIDNGIIFENNSYNYQALINNN